jgi:Protein of unknown function (DUF2891)
MGIEDKAAGWARLALSVLRTPFPYGAAHQSVSADDVDVTPARLHPAFSGALDWHSSSHMQWSLVRLLTLAPDQLDAAGLAADVRAELSTRLTMANVAVEAAYLAGRPGYERPYGWAWAAMLAAACQDCPDPAATAWAAATRPLADVIAGHVLSWLPRQAYPVRHGVHSNTAFALALLVEAFGALGRDDVVEAIRIRATTWFGSDRDIQTTFEPSGSDFLSPTLSEVELMRRLMPAAEFTDWLADFLPGLDTDRHAQLLATPTVHDRTDGQLVHLFGLALSRGWQLRELAGVLPAGAVRTVLTESADRQIAFAEDEVTTGDFMSTHWLVSFALLAELAPIH